MLLRCLFFILLLTGTQANAAIHHALSVVIDPSTSHINVEDTLSFPSTLQSKQDIEFLLHRNLVLKPNRHVERLSSDNIPPHLSLYRIKSIPDSSDIHLSYSGAIKHDLQQSGEESARSFSSTLGIIDKAGVFLDGDTAWYPYIPDQLVNFELAINIPSPWLAVSAGEKTAESTSNGSNSVRWVEHAPQDDIYLVAAPFTLYTRQAGNVEVQVYLRQDDPSLAQQYLGTAAQYLAMYQKFLGQYPYQKFAAIENFWETGYGMPSFTLLGPRVMRFPFVLHGSYPHEILHNWWGNGVFVDYEGGNWAEGLTAYLADHLIAEQRGNGANYRRNNLQKYSDYVSSGRDFPLNQFRSRHDSASEAIGYGKALMLFHMLRNELGDDTFSRGLRQFYKKYRFSKASFDDLRNTFNEASGMDLSLFFKQWLTRSGAPRLRLGKVEYVKMPDANDKLTIEIEQTQNYAPYQLSVPIVVRFADSSDKRFFLSLKERRSSITLEVNATPVAIVVDPEFDVFRRLDAREIPSALSQGFGASEALVVLPAAADNKTKNAYRQLVLLWQKRQRVKLTTVLDAELDNLPDDRPVWIFGWKNRFRQQIANQVAAHGALVNDEQLLIDNNRYSRAKHSVLITSRHPDNPDQTLLWLATNNLAALPGLARKLPHYGKYSYLVFAGDTPNNVGKGQWQVLNSPLVKVLAKETLPPLKMPTRTALAQLAPAFSEQRMMADISYLADSRRQGRGLGSQGLDEAAAYIANEFNNAGLQTYDDDYYQEWQADIEKLDANIKLRNVIGVLPGTNPSYKKQSIVIAAHYDHLGTGWPDVRAGNEGKVHPGADDNASGVAVMLELARVLGKHWRPERSILFIAFTGEEAGLLGSSHYTSNSAPYPAKQAMAILNLDSIGRLGDRPISIFGADSASEWAHIFRGIGFVTGIKTKLNERPFGASDHVNFHNIGIPGVQFFSGIHLDYHRPSDTINKVDSAGLVKVASVVRETVEYLAKRPERLSAQLGATNLPDGGQVPTQGRKISIGTVPDFDYTDDGIRLSDVIAGSPAAKAGLLSGDILQAINGGAINDLQAYANVLRNTRAGEILVIEYSRNGVTKKTAVTAIKR